MNELVVISPVRDESAHLAPVVAGVRAQTRPPDRWLIVDDGSTDGTAELAQELAADVSWIEVWRAPQQVQADDRLAVAAEARAFLWAVGRLEPGWAFLGKLDGDMVLAPEHFATLLAAFAGDKRLGIAGCFYEEQRRGRRVVAAMPAFHVNGALKLYRRPCWDQIGGIAPQLAWDTIDETLARMHGWSTRSLPAPRALHLRPAGSAAGQLRGRARHGACVWILHYPLPIVLARSVRLLAARPPVVSALAYLAGYLRAAAGRRPRVQEPGFRAFVRREQLARLGWRS